MDNKENEQLTFQIPDNKNIPCRNCPFASNYYLDYFCAKYKMKPKEIYFENNPCPFNKK